MQEQQPPVAHRRPLAQTPRNSLRVVEGEFDPRQEVGLRAVHFFLGRRRFRHLFQRGEHRFGGSLQRVLLAHLRHRAEHARLLQLKREGRRAGSQTRFHQRLVQPACRLRAEHMRHDLHRGEVFVGPRRHVIHGERELDVSDAAQRDTALAILRGFRGVGGEQLVRPGPVRTRNAPELVHDHAECVAGIEAAGDDQDRVVRLVVLAVERLQPLYGYMFDIGPRTDRGVAIVVPVVGRRHDPLLQHPAGAVLAPLPLVADDGHFRFEVFRRDEGVDHSIGLEIERPFEIVVGRRKCLEVVGPVKPGSAVRESPALGQLTGDIGVFRRTLEHQVLQQVGHPRLPVALVA